MTTKLNNIGNNSDGTDNTPAPIGHNTPPATLTNEQVKALADTVGEKMATAMQYGDRAEKAKDGAISLREEAAQELYPVLDVMLSLTRETRGAFNAKNAKENVPDYERVRIAVCEAMSIRLKDSITLPKATGNTAKPPAFTSRVSKAFSRLVTSYKEGGDGGQSQADKDAREAEKTRKQAHRDMAEALRDIIKAYASGDTDSLNVQVKASVLRWPVTNHDTIFPSRKPAA